MPTTVHEFDWPDRVVVGTIGVPGERTFYLQVRTGPQIVSVSLEKQQSALLADKIDEILDQLMNADGNPLGIPSNTPLELVDNEPLDEPLDENFRAGAMSLGWDPSTAQIVVEAYPIVDLDPDGELDGDTDFDEDWNMGPEEDVRTGLVIPTEILRVRMPVGTARAFSKRTREVVGAGRRLCPLCGDPIDLSGHDCVLSSDF
jgi:uncharacterized repeat protein (TIGR03847 family)